MIKALIPTRLVLGMAIVFVLSARCTTDISGGSGSEAGNARVAGIVFDEQGVPAPNVIVQLHPSDFDPVHDDPVIDSYIDTTADDGRYRFTVTDETLKYTVLATQMVSRLRGIVAEVKAVTSDGAGVNCSLHPPGTVRVLSRESGAGDSGYFYIPGTILYVRVSSANGYALLDSVPAGVLPSIYYTSANGTGTTLVQTDIKVPAGDTVTIAMKDWLYSGTIVLNTSVTGADVSGAVYGFPVLVRLSAATFDFSQTKSNGGDLRFLSSRGMVLPHEIELWDSAAGRAAVWVKVDTLHGNDSTQSIMMYWGNPEAAGVSTGSSVFDTANGFQGVWHLSDAAGDTVRDATTNRYHGVSPDSACPSISEGVVGKCRAFDGNEDFITMPNTADSKLDFPADGYYTVCVWALLDTFDGAPHLIVTKGFTQYYLRFTYFPSNSPSWEFVEFSETSNWHACTTTATGRRWTLLTGVREGSRQLFYCNGVLVDSTPNIYPNDNYSRNTSNDLSIGKFLEANNILNFEDSYCLFKGSIDEVRILNTAQSPEWVRLCYMNQRADDRLVVFK